MKKHKTLLYFQIYILVTFLIYYIGPILYPKVNSLEVVFLLIAYNLSFTLGYFLAHSRIRIYNKSFKNLRIRIMPILAIGFMLNIYLSLSYLIAFSGSINFVPDVIIGITNPAEAYLRNILIEDKANLATKLSTLFSPLTYASIPLAIIHYKKIGFKLKILFFTSIFLLISTFLIKGTNFLIIFLAITITITTLVNNISALEKIPRITLSKKIFLGLAFFYFFHSISSRMQLDTVPSTIYHINVNQDHMLFKVLPDTISVPLMLGTSYISQGYYGLSLATSYEFPNTLGLGNGVFIMSKLEEATRNSIWEKTYQFQMSHLWDPRIHWHTAYVWIANDIGLYGVIFAMFILGLFFSLIIKDAVTNKSTLAIILLPLYTIMLLFIPSNNIIFNNPMLFMSFVILNIMWVTSKKWAFKI